jgi:hypothetical protein
MLTNGARRQGRSEFENRLLATVLAISATTFVIVVFFQFQQWYR